MTVIEARTMEAINDLSRTMRELVEEERNRNSLLNEQNRLLAEQNLILLKGADDADRPQGEWIRTSNDWINVGGVRYYPIHCSICNYPTYDDSVTNFCPDCGSRMRKPSDCSERKRCERSRR